MDQHTKEQIALAAWERHERMMRTWTAIRSIESLAGHAPEMSESDIEDSAAWIWGVFTQTPSLEPLSDEAHAEQAQVYARLIRFLDDEVAIQFARDAWGDREFTSRGLLGYGVAWSPDENTIVATYHVLDRGVWVPQTRVARHG
ncbi:hypothetical protein BKA24_001655 [Microbacterium marinum]|uniref:Uncharacterized protein n=1 Tax=Microbacterium marinum TaxID=421115 RepID=A0A7W7BSC3_9MICO|nr:hypothetical protein [Microbacterium marinum]MBB4666946.1 hypothetical protein [Microbacterium marinum]